GLPANDFSGRKLPPAGRGGRLLSKLPRGAPPRSGRSKVRGRDGPPERVGRSRLSVFAKLGRARRSKFGRGGRSVPSTPSTRRKLPRESPRAGPRGPLRSGRRKPPSRRGGRSVDGGLRPVDGGL